MIALTAGEPPLEVPRTPFALFCSSIKRTKSAKKNMSQLQRLIQANGVILLFLSATLSISASPCFGSVPFSIVHKVSVLVAESGGGGRHSFHPPKPSCWQRACFVITFCVLQPSFCVFLTYALQSCIGAFCLSEL